MMQATVTVVDVSCILPPVMLYDEVCVYVNEAI